ncbi:MAG: S24/S26 family peptidase [Pseudomonadota bacterium]
MSLFGITFVRIAGASMEPELPDGSIALFYARKRVEQGDVVLVNHIEFGVIVKRVRAVDIDGGVWLEGTSSASTSADKLGRVAASQVRGTLVFRLS